jgi:hypothetical protein
MKTEKELLQIMDHLDGHALKETENDFQEEIQALKNCASGMKILPYDQVSAESDKRFQEFMASISVPSKTNKAVRLRTISIISAIAAGLALLLIFYPFQNMDILEDFRALSTNPDKLSFVYELTSEKLSNEDIEDVKSLLAIEPNPNIKVSILDLLDNYTPEYVGPEELFLNLNSSRTPSVQMAMLNSMEATDISRIQSDLDQFLRTEGLEETVTNKIQEMLKNVESKNYK